MKLPTKKKYFDMIKSGKKRFEYRDAHITFICEETGETLKKDIINALLLPKSFINKNKEIDMNLFDDSILIEFELK